MLATGLAENMTHMVFRQPFVIQHVRYLMWLYPHQNEINFCFLLSFFCLTAFVFIRDLSHKNA